LIIEPDMVAVYMTQVWDGCIEALDHPAFILFGGRGCRSLAGVDGGNTLFLLYKHLTSSLRSSRRKEGPGHLILLGDRIR